MQKGDWFDALRRSVCGVTKYDMAEMNLFSYS